MRGGRGRGTGGEEGANALLMGFIQAWRLQARPPLGRVGVNPPPQAPHLSDCSYSREAEHELDAASGPHL